jgi:hypothetical protein
MGMVFLEVLKLAFDLRHATGCGEYFAVGFRFPRSATIARHSGCFWTEVLGRWSVNSLGFQRMAGYVFRQSSFSQAAIATHLPHFANPLDFDGARQLSGSSFPVTRDTRRNILILDSARKCLPDTSKAQRLTGNANGQPIIYFAKAYSDKNRLFPSSELTRIHLHASVADGLR